MTDPTSLNQIENLLAALPGIISANLTRSNAHLVIGTVRCESLAGFDALARCATGANVTVTLGQSESSEFRKLNSVPYLNCHIEFNDDDIERPTVCERFGFYAAIFLYNESLVDDQLLDRLESIWNVDFSRNAG